MFEQPDLFRADLPSEVVGTGIVTKFSRQQTGKKVKQKKPKPSNNKKSYGFCKELSNMFVSGGIPLERFNMHGKTKFNSISHPAVGEPPPVHCPPQTAAAPSAPAKPQDTGVPLTSASTAGVHIVPTLPPAAGVPLPHGTPLAAGVPPPHSTPLAAGVPLASALPLPPLTTPEPSPDWIDPFAYAGMSVPVETGKKRKRKTCGDNNCGPCGVLEDCSICRYCRNKKLK